MLGGRRAPTSAAPSPTSWPCMRTPARRARPRRRPGPRRPWMRCWRRSPPSGWSRASFAGSCMAPRASPTPSCRTGCRRSRWWPRRVSRTCWRSGATAAATCTGWTSRRRPRRWRRRSAVSDCASGSITAARCWRRWTRRSWTGWRLGSAGRASTASPCACCTPTPTRRMRSGSAHGCAAWWRTCRCRTRSTPRRGSTSGRRRPPTTPPRCRSRPST